MSYTPASVKSLSGYNKEDFFHDLLSGIMVGIIAIPMALAFAIASGVRPEQGLYTSIFAGVVIAVLGGSRHQISGPTGAFVVVILAIVNQYGYSGLATATIMAGLMLILLGVFKLGSLIKYMPYPVIIGFTSGIAVVIFSTQIGNILGITLANKSESVIINYQQYFTRLGETNLYALGVAVGTLLVTVALGKINKKVPASLLAIVLATCISYFFNLPITTIGSEYGSIPSHLPMPAFPHISLDTIQKLFPAAITIALLGAVESLLSATVADGITKARHNSNAELIGQGVGNFISPIFQGIPATGAIVRTAANIRFGGRTPLSSIVHCATLVFVVLFLSKLASYVPLSALAGILMLVAWNMSEVHAFKKTFKTTHADVLVLVSTFLLTVFTDLTTAIAVGIIISALSLIQRTSKESIFTAHTPDDFSPQLSGLENIENVSIIHLKGGLFFGTTDKLHNLATDVMKKSKTPQIVVLKMTDIYFIDASGINALTQAFEEFKSSNIKLFLCSLNPQPQKAILNSHFYSMLDKETIHPDLRATFVHIRDRALWQPAKS